MFDEIAELTPADDPFWSVTIGDPGPDALFDTAVYDSAASFAAKMRATRRRVQVKRPGADILEPNAVRVPHCVPSGGALVAST